MEYVDMNTLSILVFYLRMEVTFYNCWFGAGLDLRAAGPRAGLT